MQLVVKSLGDGQVQVQHWKDGVYCRLDEVHQVVSLLHNFRLVLLDAAVVLHNIDVIKFQILNLDVKRFFFRNI